MRRTPAFVAVLAGGLVPLAGPTAAPAWASAPPTGVLAAEWHDGACTSGAGVTVVVDFQDLGGGVNVRCAAGAPTSGLDALTRADVAWEGTQRFPTFLCRIAGKPGPDADPCVNTPPASAYWSYWIAARGGQWCASSRGAGSRRPPEGTVEGWSFALRRAGSAVPPPRTAPPSPAAGEAPVAVAGGDCAPAESVAPAEVTTTTAAVTPPPPPAPTASSSTAPVTSAPTGAPAATVAPVPAATTGPSAVVPPTERPATSTTAGPGASTTTPPSTTGPPPPASPAPAPSTTVAASTSTTAAAAPSSSAPTTGAGGDDLTGSVDLSDDGRGGGGFGPGTAVGVLIVAGLVGAAGWGARRRRQAER